MKINPHAPLFAAVAAEARGPGKATDSAAPTPGVTAEPAKAMTRDPLIDSLNSKQREVLKSRLASKAQSENPTAAAASASPEAPTQLEKLPEAPAAAATPNAQPEKPKSGDDVKPVDEPDAGVIDFTKLDEVKPAPEDGAPAPLTEAELADLTVVQKKLTEAHKDNAAQRKLKREALEAKTQLEAQNQTLSDQIEQLRAQAQQGASHGVYLDRAQSVERADQLKADAIEALRQLQANPETEIIRLPGNREWPLVTTDGKHLGALAAQDMFDIIDGYDAKVKQLRDREAAKKVVDEKLPLLKKAVPDLEATYQKLLASDWSAQAPQISLDAALGQLVREGKFVMVPAGRQAAAKPASVPAKTPVGDLPTTTPAMREAKPGKPDVSALKAKAMKGDQKALAEWIKKSGKAKVA